MIATLTLPQPWARPSRYGITHSKWDSPLTVFAYLARHSDIDYESGCFHWTSPGALPNGYVSVHGPTINGKRKREYIHRAAYQWFVGPIPPGREIDHVSDRGCTHRSCWRPDHLEPVTHAINMNRIVIDRADKAR